MPCDAQVWRVCNYLHALEAKHTRQLRPCRGCGRVTMSQGRPLQTYCYLLAMQLVNTIETGNPKGEDDDGCANR